MEVIRLMYLLILVVLSCMFNLTVLAHSGGLNGRGCHDDPVIRGYHCHVYPSSVDQDKFVGIPKIVDGDTIKIGDTRIRLHGIDAPETNQRCFVNGREWRCGWEASNALANIVGKNWVTCKKRSMDRFNRVVAVCWVGTINLNSWMVRNGWAVAYRRYSTDYVRDEEVSRIQGKGLWGGEFIMPWDWRRSN